MLLQVAAQGEEASETVVVTTKPQQVKGSIHEFRHTSIEDDLAIRFEAEDTTIPNVCRASAYLMKIMSIMEILITFWVNEEELVGNQYVLFNTFS